MFFYKEWNKAGNSKNVVTSYEGQTINLRSVDAKNAIFSVSAVTPYTPGRNWGTFDHFFIGVTLIENDPPTSTPRSSWSTLRRPWQIVDHLGLELLRRPISQERDNNFLKRPEQFGSHICVHRDILKSIYNLPGWLLANGPAITRKYTRKPRGKHHRRELAAWKKNTERKKKTVWQHCIFGVYFWDASKRWPKKIGTAAVRDSRFNFWTTVFRLLYRFWYLRIWTVWIDFSKRNSILVSEVGHTEPSNLGLLDAGLNVPLC